MSCSICKVVGHNYNHCNNPIIDNKSTLLFNRMIEVIETPLNYYILSEHTMFPTSTHYSNIKKYMNRVTVGWNLPLWKRVFPKVIELLHNYGCTQYIREFIRLSTDNQILHPTCSTHYKLHIAGLSQYISRQLVEIEDVRFKQNLHTVTPIPISFHLDNADIQYFHDGGCPICMDHIDDTNTIAFSCLHAFCSSCVGEFIQRSHNKCPSCREDIVQFHFKSGILPQHFNRLSQIHSID